MRASNVIRCLSRRQGGFFRNERSGFLRRGSGFLKRLCLVRRTEGGALLKNGGGGGFGFLRRRRGFLETLWSSLRSSTPPPLCVSLTESSPWALPSRFPEIRWIWGKTREVRGMLVTSVGLLSGIPGQAHEIAQKGLGLGWQSQESV